MILLWLLKAFSIQAIEAPKFDKLIILLGNFHLELAVFGALGTYINESGGDNLLVEAGVIAGGSLMDFFRGTLYNRCTRVHEILASTLEDLLFESFLSSLAEEQRLDFEECKAEVPDSYAEQKIYFNGNKKFTKYGNAYDRYFLKVMD